MKKLVLILISIISFNINAGDKGNGGDVCENRIIDIRNDIKKWIKAGAATYLDLPNGILASEYSDKMLMSMDQAVISCSDEDLFIVDAQKTCVNTINEETNKPFIKCSFKRFNNQTDESNQYKLIHHEYAGLAGFEMNLGKSESNYFISNQVTRFLEDKIIKKLSISPNRKEVLDSRTIITSDYIRIRKYTNNRITIETCIPSSDPMQPDAYCRSIGGMLRKDRVINAQKLWLREYSNINTFFPAIGGTFGALLSVLSLHPAMGLGISAITLTSGMIITVKSGSYYVQELEDKRSLNDPTSKVLQNVNYIKSTLESANEVIIPTDDLEESKKNIVNLLRFFGEVKRLEGCAKKSKYLVVRLWDSGNCALRGQSTQREY